MKDFKQNHCSWIPDILNVKPLSQILQQSWYGDTYMNAQPFVHRKSRKKRGKGFSSKELKENNLSFKDALKLGIPIDKRRTTKHQDNIASLKSYLSHHATKPTEPKDALTEKARSILKDLEKTPNARSKQKARQKQPNHNVY